MATKVFWLAIALSWYRNKIFSWALRDFWEPEPTVGPVKGELLDSPAIGSFAIEYQFQLNYNICDNGVSKTIFVFYFHWASKQIFFYNLTIDVWWFAFDLPQLNNYYITFFVNEKLFNRLLRPHFLNKQLNVIYFLSGGNLTF